MVTFYGSLNVHIFFSHPVDKKKAGCLSISNFVFIRALIIKIQSVKILKSLGYFLIYNDKSDKSIVTFGETKRIHCQAC